MSAAIEAAYEAWDAYKPSMQDVSGHGAMEAAMRAAINAMSESIVAAVSGAVHVRDGQTVVNGPAVVEAILSAIDVGADCPSPALGGYEPKANEQKDHPTPVGGLEPVAWIYGREGIDRYADLKGPTEEERAAYTIEPLYSSSTVSTLQAEIERLREALEQISQWADAYPLDIFPEPDFKAVRVALEAHGLTLDSVSASNMRHVVTGVGRIARQALGKHHD